MNRKDKEIAIALACGAKWQEVPAQSGNFYDSLSEEERNFSDQLHPKRILSFRAYDFQSPICAPLPFPDSKGDAVSIPDYFNDINAMHEAESILDDLQQCQFCDALFRLMNSPDGVSEFMKVHATASQRAEAFGITLNLWKP